MAFRTIDDRGSVVVVMGPKTPSDGEWNALVDAHKRERHQRSLIVTDGGGPSPTQRKRVLDVTGGKGLPAVILTDSVVVRGIVTALSWFAPDIRAYARHDLQSAVAYLELTTPILDIQRTIDELHRELEVTSSRARTA